MTQPRGPERSQSYTVAWIAALPKERAAGVAMFDQGYAKPPADFKINGADPNSYSWGKIGEHYVVLVSLPKGTYGTTSTATVAQGLRSSLPHVRIGLLVGIGAGVREILDGEGKMVGQRDIRLGDVVISSPEDTFGGVVQFDFVKAKNENGDEVLQRQGSMNSPPLALGTALANLEATHMMTGPEAPAFITEAFKKFPRMESDFGHPGLKKADIDRKTDTYHSGDGTPILSDARECPLVHYGIIASSNTLVKSVHHRTDVLGRLAKENIKPVCFEMEAAGLMNFPCLVLRGICDYADEHKNDDWQKYAAITAAAVAKELLLCVDVQAVQETQEISKLILQRMGTLHQAVEQNREDVSYLKMSADAHRRSHILDWLCSYDYSTQFEICSAKYLRGTGQWFLEDSTFLSWVQADLSSTLICPGGPGCGKTIISTLVIDYLRNASGIQKPVIYFFFDYQRQEEQTADVFVATLLRQLASLSQEVFSAVEKFHNRFVFQNRRPSLDDLQSELRSAFQSITGVFVVIDAWDECESVKRAECANMLRGCLSQRIVHLLATTRDNYEVQGLLDGDLTLRIRANAEDLTLYTGTRAAELAPNLRDNKELVKNVIKGVIDASDGVFLLARLHMNSIKDHLTANEIKETLTGLRKDIGSYSSAYKATMERVNGQQKRRHGLAMRILAWVVHAKRPLSFGELNHALATRPGKPSIDGDDTYAKEVILSVCAGLVTLDDTYGSPVRLIHYTAQEYLCDTWMQWFSTESAEIVDVCLTYLLFDEFKHPCIDWQTLSSRHYHYTLFEYAAQNWAYHFKDKKCRRKGDCKTTRMALIFLLDRFSVCSAVQALDRLSPEGYDLMCHGIHLTAYLGLEDLTMLLIDVMRVKPDLADIGLRTPLWWAARQGHTDVVKALLGTKRVNVNRRDRYNGNWPYTYGQTPLAVAAGNGHEEVVDVLLATERTVFDTRDLRGRSPLLLAAEKGHENIVRILLDTGHSDVNEIDYYDRTPLSCAAANGHEGVVKALLATKGVDVNWKVYGQTPLFDAVRCSHEGAVKALLAAEGVDIHWEDPHGRTALDVAKHNLHTGIIGMLKAAGASDTSKSKRQEQPTE